MKKIIALLLILTLLFTGCSGNNKSSGSENVTPDGIERKEYKMLYSSEEDMNYLKAYGTDVPCVIIDGLVDYDKYGVLVPSMATEWSKSEDGLVYTFKLREGVKWYTYDKKEYAEVVADDFVAGLKFILTQSNAAGTANLVYDYIVNAKEFYDGDITDFSQVGIKAIDKYTVQYTLKHPVPYFLRLSGYNCYWPVNQQFLDEVGEKFGTTADTLLYNGAYIMTEKYPEDKTILEMNENYWNKDKIYISKITQTFNKDKSIQGELFQRGEIDQSSISAELKEEWINDTENKGKWATRAPKSPNSWFYGFNFEPKYEGHNVEDYKVAVNNVNFRKSIFHGFDRIALILTFELWTPEDMAINTITPPKIMTNNGKDFVETGALKNITEENPFNEAKALEYKEKAMAELKGKVNFPIKLVVPYNTGDKSLTNQSQVLEQQLEKLLGTDYIDVVLEAYPPTNYNTSTRSAGNFSIMQMRWGADYADPASYTDIFNPDLSVGKKYCRPYLSTEYLNSNGEHEYLKLLNAGLEEVNDVEKRWDLLAEAEAFLIDEALVIPTFQSGNYWWLCKLDPFEGFNNQFGRDEDVLKGKRVLDKPLTREEYKEAEARYYKEREEAQKNAKNQQ